MTLEEAERWLASLINVEQLPDLRRARLTLAPVRRLLDEIGAPERGLRVFHVAGSKGKGSTVLFAEALLRGAGRSVAAFTSPHLESWVERFRIDGAPVSGVLLAGAVERLRPVVEKLRLEPEAPSFFDVTTAAALLLFAEARVEAVLLEVGLGGRLDSTNVVSPAVTCVTSIELEHTEKLGDTLARIAAEKAGIAKPGIPMLIGPLHPEAEEAVAVRCAEIGAPLLRVGAEGADIQVEASPGRLGCARATVVDGTLRVAAELGVAGAHQAFNAALAVGGVRRLGLVADAELAASAATSLSKARLPARLELVSREPWIVVDGAHTPVSARALAEMIVALPPTRRHLVVSVSADKDQAEICAVLLPLMTSVTVTRADPHRSLPPAELAGVVSALAPELSIRVVEDPRAAVLAARDACRPDELLIAAGSIYLAGIARSLLAPAS